MEDITKKPLVVIHCITYNHEPYIRDCLNGFVMQKTNFSFVAIVHDDASTDKTADIIREYAEKYPDIIKPIYETENQYSKQDGSLERIMDAAVEKYNPKYIAYCEGDDYWIDYLKLQKQVDVLEKNSDYGFCYTDYNVVDENGLEIENSKWHNTNSCRFKSGDLFYALLWGNFIQTCTILFKKNLKEKKYFVNGELDYTLFLYLSGRTKFYYLPEVMSCYRLQPKGISTSGAILHNKGCVDLINSSIYLCSRLYLENYFPRRCFFLDKIIKARIMYRLIQRDRIHRCNTELRKMMIDNKILFFYFPQAFLHRFLAKIKNRYCKE